MELRTLTLRKPSNELHRMKAENLKKAADAAMTTGNFRLAYTKYSDCLIAKPYGEGVHKILSNRSLAYCKSCQFFLALKDADKVVEIAPTWHKGYFRRGTSLIGLRRLPEAVAAFCAAWSRTPPQSRHGAEILRHLSSAVRGLTREQIADGMIVILMELVHTGKMLEPAMETTGLVAMREAMFCEIKDAGRGGTSTNRYYENYFEWLKGGIPLHVAYSERAAMFMRANCFHQSKLDAGYCIRLAPDWSIGYIRLGLSAKANPHSKAWDPILAARAFGKAVELEPRNIEHREYFSDAIRELSKEQMNKVVHQKTECPETHPCRMGFLENANGGIVLCVKLALRFPDASIYDFDGHTRKALRMCIAVKGCIPIDKVLITSLAIGRPIDLILQVLFGANREKAEDFISLMKTSMAAVLDVPTLVGRIGKFDATSFETALLDETGVLHEDEVKFNKDLASVLEGRNVSTSSTKLDQGLSLQIHLPYKSYRLCKKDGTPVERADKHPFQMSRAYYNAWERNPLLWVEVRDGALRWTQSSSEVIILLRNLPSNWKSADMVIHFGVCHVKVSHRTKGDVYLDQRLEREIIPDECTWEHYNSSGDRCILLTLQKLNLELLQAVVQHSDMWWPRLFIHDTPIEWDDYDKDYSDLPASVMVEHRMQDFRGYLQVSKIHEEEQEKKSQEERDKLRKVQREYRLYRFR